METNPARAAAVTAKSLLPDLVVLGICLLSLFAFLGARDIEGVRERRLAGSAADIDRNGRWLLPELLGEPRFLKPPLADWLAAGSLRLLGRSELAFRLPFALAGLGMMAASYAVARRLQGAAAARLAALILATTLYFTSECHAASTDLLLGLSVGLALLAWQRWQEDPRPGSRWWWLFYLALALGFLAKGPLVLALAAIPVLLELWASRRPGLVLRLRPWWGLLVVVAVAVPWPVLVWRRIPDAPQRWWADMRLSLARDDGQGSVEVLGYLRHLSQWPGFAAPWTVLGLASLGLPLLRRHLADWPRLRAVYFWIAGNLLFLSTWAMQPMHHLLPLAVPLAVLEAALGQRLLDALRSGAPPRPALWAARLLCLGFAAVAVYTGAMMRVRAAVGLPLAVTAGLALVAPAAAALVQLRARPAVGLGLLVSSGLLSVLLTAGVVQPAISREKGEAGFARAVGAAVPSSDPIYFTESREALPFYADREFRRLPPPGDGRGAGEALRSAGQGFVLAGREAYDRLAGSSAREVELEVLARSGERSRDGELLLVRFRALSPASRTSARGAP